MSTNQILFALAYQIPPCLMGLMLKWLIPIPAIRMVFVLPGTLVHEALHLIVGLLMNGKPVSMSLWPKKVGPGQWVLGSVGFRNLQWYNAMFIGLAPLLAIVGVMLFSPTHKGWSPTVTDLEQWAITTPILAMCLPSGVDLKLSLKSWPIIVTLLAWWLLVFIGSLN